MDQHAGNAGPDLHSERLSRLAAYLAEDPGNPSLLADTFDTALITGRLDEAEGLLLQADRLGLLSPAWRHRRARHCIARRDLRAAECILETLLGDAPDDLALLHDLAYVKLLEGEPARCRDMLAGRLGDFSGTLAGDALQVLWLRAMHRLGSLRDAWAWVRQELARGSLSPRAKGVASLIAFDLQDFASARSLADSALVVDDTLVEALVARGCVALALRRTDEASLLLRRARDRAPRDGRIWSALGLCSLDEGDFEGALDKFQRALQTVPDHIGTWIAMGWAQLLQGDPASARSTFETAVRIDRNFAESHGGLALALALSGDAAAAGRHLCTADALDRCNVSGQYARALLAGKLVDRRTVQALAQQLLDRPGFFGGRLNEALVAARPS